MITQLLLQQAQAALGGNPQVPPNVLMTPSFNKYKPKKHHHQCFLMRSSSSLAIYETPAMSCGAENGCKHYDASSETL
jgi:hypothetical protein